MTHQILITGVRGKTGAPLADLLAARGDVLVRGGTSVPADLAGTAFEPVAFSWDEHSTWAAASTDIDAVFLVRPDRPAAPELIEAFIDHLATDCRVVMLSELDRGFFTYDDWSMRVERVVRDSGRPWTILRPNWFMQVFSDPRFFYLDLVEHSVVRFPSAGQAVAWIDVRDISAVAERTLIEEGHAGQIYDLTGPAALSLDQVVEHLSHTLGRRVRHEDISLEEALGNSTGFQRENDLGAYQRIRNGMASLVTDTVEQLTGATARNFKQFAHDELGSPET